MAKGWTFAEPRIGAKADGERVSARNEEAMATSWGSWSVYQVGSGVARGAELGKRWRVLAILRMSKRSSEVLGPGDISSRRER